jgi:hypothetical protein
VNGYDYDVSQSNGDLQIQIGNADYTVSGTQTYVISYHIQFQQDGVEQYDYLYWNLIGTDWAADIQRAEFTVIMPQEFDSSKVNFTAGSIGSEDNSYVNYSVNGTTISGYLTKPLSYYEGVTMKVELENGYFNPPVDYTVVIIAILSLTLFLFAFITFLRYGRDRK